MALETVGEIDIVWCGVQAGASYKIVFIEVLYAVFRQKKCFRCGITYKAGTRKLLIGGLRDKMAGLAGNLLKLSYKNSINATIYRYHVKYACI